MIEELTIQNFRCFETLKLKNLRRINIIVGRNAVGKTALLEALRMNAGGTPAIANWLNQVRGIQSFFLPNMSREQFESLWNHFFFKRENTRHIIIASRDSAHFDRSVEIFFDPSQAITQTGPTTIPQGAEATAIQRIIPPTVIVPLVFVRSSPAITGPPLKATVLPNGQPVLEPGPELGPTTAVMGAIVGYQPQDSSAWFGQLITQNRESEILELVQREYPEVKALAVVPNPLGPASIWVTVPYLRDKEPLALLSAGINKFVTLVLAAHIYKDGLLLIDEIENGSYFDRLSSLWAALHRVTKESNSQVFVTTHSLECLKAALNTIREDENDFSLIRIKRTNGDSTAKQLAGRDMISAIEEGVEIRG
ncbi:MAG TPA: AAA family ATPase [Candidatus Binataceae bacterium]|nr:AAA family ATPase [Candidatus Binataceae bacterium]